MSRTISLIRAVVGILQRGNKILIAERPAHKSHAGFWEFPGGKIEQHESGYDALQRELHEELGIHVTQAIQWLTHQHCYANDKHVSLELWIVTDFSGEPRSNEQQQLAWVTYQELSKYKLLEGNIALLDDIKKLLASKESI